MISLQHLCGGVNFVGVVLGLFTNHKTINFPYFKERGRCNFKIKLRRAKDLNKHFFVNMIYNPFWIYSEILERETKLGFQNRI